MGTMIRLLQLSGAVLLTLIVSFVRADRPASERALAVTSSDSSLRWGPCPAFLPKGCGLAVLHGDPARDNADVFFKVPGKSTIANHWHTSRERMVLVAGELHITYDGQRRAVLKPGTYAYGPAKKAHSGYCASKEPCILFIAFESPVDAAPIEGATK